MGKISAGGGTNRGLMVANRMEYGIPSPRIRSQLTECSGGDSHPPSQIHTQLPTVPEDPWSSNYNRTDADRAPAQVVTVFTFGEQTLYEAHEKCSDAVPASAPILIDSGASLSRAGRYWIQAWNCGLLQELQPSSRPFKFGAGPAQTRLGIAVTPLEIAQMGETKYPSQCQLEIDIVDLEVSCPTSRQSHGKLDAQIDFATKVTTV